jgi:hypothetical protein
MPNVVIVRNTYPDNAALNNVIHYALNKAAFCGGYGITPEIGAAQMQMQFVKRAFHQTDALQLKHFLITYSHDETAYVDFDEMMLTAFEAAKLFGEYQMVYGLHLDGSHVHVHIVMNTTSFIDGHQYSDGLSGFMKVCGMLKKKYPQYRVKLCQTRPYTLKEPFIDADREAHEVLKEL